MYLETEMKNLFKRFTKNEKGATAIEYGLIAALIAVVIIGGLTTMGQKTSDQFNTIGNTIGSTTAAS